MGIFITFEGVEGCGKSTQARRLARHLRQSGHQVILTQEPGGSPLGREIRQILLDYPYPLDPLVELLLYLADRYPHTREVIKPSLKKGKMVIADRFGDSTMAYQGYGRGINHHFIKSLHRRVVGGLRPDLTLLLDCPAELGLSRAAKRHLKDRRKMDRMEREPLEFHQRVRKGYLEIYKKNRPRIKLINATRSITEVQKEITRVVEDFITSKK